MAPSPAKLYRMTTTWDLHRLLDAMAARGEAPALIAVHGGKTETWSHARLAEQARALAAALVGRGVAPGDPVAVVGPNGADWTIVRLALGAAGALGVPLDDLSSPLELATTLRDSGARWVFAGANHLDAARPLAEELGARLFALDADGDAPHWSTLLGAETPPLPPLAADSPAALIYTSGTTGDPKSFVLSHANIAANVTAIIAENIIGHDDRVLLPLPLHHAYPYVVGLLTPLASGACVVFPEAPTGPEIVAALKAARATTLIGVPRLYTALIAGIEARVAARGRLARTLFGALLSLSTWARQRLGWRLGRRLFASLHRQMAPDLVHVVSGGAKLEPPFVWRLEALGWQVMSGYGLAETASIFTGNRPGAWRVGSEGKALPGGEIRIGEPDQAGIGEIQLKGASVFAGYRNDPDANAAAFTPDGWFRTGDLGRLDADGFVEVTGRAKEMIVLGGGKNVYPEDVEKVYAASAAVQEIALLERAGALVALVLPDVTAIRDGGTDRVEDAVRVALGETAATLPSHQRLAGYMLVREPLPRTRLGKFRRFMLPDIYDGAETPRPAAPKELTDEDRALLAASPAKEIWAFLGERYAGKGLALDASPQLDLGIDSLEWLGLALELERRFGATLDDDALARAHTMRELLAEIVAAADTAAAPAIDLDPWFQPLGAGQIAVGAMLYGLNWGLMRLMFRVSADGREHLPAAAPYLLAANHASDIDAMVLAAALPYRRMRRIWWGLEITRIAASGLTHWLMRTCNVFPVNERTPAATLDAATRVLESDALAWFPESWRSPDGKLQRFLPGVGVVLARRPVPVVPAWIEGTFAAMPRGRHLPRPAKVTIRFGGAIAPEALDLSSPEATAMQLQAALAKLVP